MTETTLLRHLVELEHALERRKQNALVRANWAKVIGVEAQLALLTEIRKTVAGPETGFQCDSCKKTFSSVEFSTVVGTKTYCHPCWTAMPQKV